MSTIRSGTMDFEAEATRMRPIMLRAYRHAASPEDLEDIYQHALLEVWLWHQRERLRNVADAIELKFRSRLWDRLRAISGRSANVAGNESALSIEPDMASVPSASRVAEGRLEFLELVAGMNQRQQEAFNLRPRQPGITDQTWHYHRAQFRKGLTGSAARVGIT